MVIFLLGVLFWQFVPFYFPQNVNDFIWNLTSSTYKVLHLKDMTEVPQINPIDELPTEDCPDYKELVTIYEHWLEKFGAKSNDSRMFKSFISSEEPAANGLNGIVKWRYQDNFPYYGLNTPGEWEHVVGNANITKMTHSLEIELIPQLEKKGFFIQKSMDIPFYRYPDGLGAKKIGVIKNNSAYLLGLFEQNINEFKEWVKSGNLPYDLKTVKNPLAARVSCAKLNSADESRFMKFIALPHTFPNETVVFSDDMGNGLTRFGLIYPGGSNDYYEHQFIYEKDGRLVKLQTTGEFPLCSIFEAAKVGKDTICYRPEVKEFSVVMY